jgi:hypothetical protein
LCARIAYLAVYDGRSASPLDGGERVHSRIPFLLHAAILGVVASLVFLAFVARPNLLMFLSELLYMPLISIGAAVGMRLIAKGRADNLRSRLLLSATSFGGSFSLLSALTVAINILVPLPAQAYTENLLSAAILTALQTSLASRLLCDTGDPAV